MPDNYESKPILKLDEVWFSHANAIREVAENITRPKTLEGEKIAQEILLRSFLIEKYPRLNEILEALIALIEFDEIGKFRNKKFFTDSNRQRIVLRAFGLVVEKIIQDPYSQEEGKTYDDYQPFFNGLIKRLKDLDNKIKTKGPLPNLIDSLVSATGEGINTIPRVKNFKINTMTIRKMIREYLPKLVVLDKGKIMSEIENKMEEPFSF